MCSRNILKTNFFPHTNVLEASPLKNVERFRAKKKQLWKKAGERLVDGVN